MAKTRSEYQHGRRLDGERWDSVTPNGRVEVRWKSSKY